MVTGKPVLSDLRTRKKTVPVVAALSSHTGSGANCASGPATQGTLRLRRPRSNLWERGC
jgi:geranylgeranyl diphosphate synthase, type I